MSKWTYLGSMYVYLCITYCRLDCHWSFCLLLIIFFKQPKQHCREQARSNRGHEACPSGIRSLMYFFLIFNNLKIRKFVPTSFFSCHFTLKNHASCLFGFVRNIKQKLRILWHYITEIKWKNHSVVKLLVNEILLNFDYYQKSCQRKQFNL